MEHPRLRDRGRLHADEPYPLNAFTDDLVYAIGGYIVYLLHTGRTDIGGDDWGDAFANAIGGEHLKSPLGIADVTKGKMAWSMKTVKNPHPHEAKTVRIISGRCSPDYSYGITDPHADIDKTGIAVLGIWNERVNIATDNFNQVRETVLIRSNDVDEFTLFESECQRFRTNEYIWEENSNGNLLGRNKTTGDVKFTWQPHGAQFTIHETVPTSAVRFKIRKPQVITVADALRTVGYDRSWIEIRR